MPGTKLSRARFLERRAPTDLKPLVAITTKLKDQLINEPVHPETLRPAPSFRRAPGTSSLGLPNPPRASCGRLQQPSVRLPRPQRQTPRVRRHDYFRVTTSKDLGLYTTQAHGIFSEDANHPRRRPNSRRPSKTPGTGSNLFGGHYPRRPSWAGLRRWKATRLIHCKLFYITIWKKRCKLRQSDR